MPSCCKTGALWSTREGPVRRRDEAYNAVDSSTGGVHPERILIANRCQPSEEPLSTSFGGGPGRPHPRPARRVPLGHPKGVDSGRKGWQPNKRPARREGIGRRSLGSLARLLYRCANTMPGNRLSMLGPLPSGSVSVVNGVDNADKDSIANMAEPAGKTRPGRSYCTEPGRGAPARPNLVHISSIVQKTSSLSCVTTCNVLGFA